MYRFLLLLPLLFSCRPNLRPITLRDSVSTFSFAEVDIVATRGRAFSGVTPRTVGDISVFSVSPPLPAGLVLDPSTGTLNGIPQALSPKTSYVVSGQSTNGVSTVSLSLQVIEEAPSELQYARQSDILFIGKTFTPNSLSHGVGLPSRFDVVPSLPAGLILDPATGQISGLPSAATGLNTYTVTASNGSGEASTTVEITVYEAPPVLGYVGSPFRVVQFDALIDGSPTNTGGPIHTCNVTPALPQGLALDPLTCTISGFATVLAEKRSYQVIADHPTHPASVDVELEVVAPLSIFPARVELLAGTNDEISFTASGGHPPYLFSRQGQGSFDPITTTLTAPPHPSKTTITVTDSRGIKAVASIETSRVATDGVVRAVASHQNGVIVGGQFERASPYPRNRFAALDLASGKPDLAVASGNGFDSSVLAIATTADSVFVGGDFAHYDGVPTRGIAKLDKASGALDASYFTSSDLFNTLDGKVIVLLLAATPTSLLIGGSFNVYRGTTVGSATAPALTLMKIALADGALEWAVVLPSPAQSLLATETDVYAGTANTLQRYNLSDGAFVSSLPTGLAVKALAANTTHIYLGLGASGAGGQLRRIDRTTGVVDAAFTPLSGYLNAVRGIALGPDEAYVVGDIALPGNSAPKGVLRVPFVSGVVDAAFIASGASATLGAYNAVYTPSGLIVVGSMINVLGLKQNNIAVFHPTTGALLNQRFKTGFDATTFTAKADGDRLFVGGSFNFYGGDAVSNLARFDVGTGAHDTNFSAQVSAVGAVRALAVVNDDVYIGGDITNFGPSGAASPRLLRVGHANGTWTKHPSYTANTNGTIYSIVANGANVFAGGEFTSYGVTSANGVVKLTPNTAAVQTTFTSGGGVAVGQVLALHLDSAHLWIGGQFNNYRATAITSIARVTQDTGALEATTFGANEGFKLGGSTPIVRAITGVADDDVIIGGDFDGVITNTPTVVGARNIVRIAAKSVATSQGVGFGAPLGFDAPVRAIATAFGLAAYAGGEFVGYRVPSVNERRLQRLISLSYNFGQPIDEFGTAGFDNTIGYIFTEFAASPVVLALQRTGAILFAGGAFTSYRGAPAGGLVGLDPISGEQVF